MVFISARARRWPFSQDHITVRRRVRFTTLIRVRSARDTHRRRKIRIAGGFGSPKLAKATSDPDEGLNQPHRQAREGERCVRDGKADAVLPGLGMGLVAEVLVRFLEVASAVAAG